MNGYLYLNNIFSTVLQQSQAIAGRFFITYRHGREINNDLLGQVLSEVTTNLPLVKYPLALMTPPAFLGSFDKADGWALAHITIAFLRTSYYNSDNTIAALNENTQTSNRPILEDWGDMAQEAVMFLRMLTAIVRVNNNMAFLRMPKNEHTITPITSTGVDRASGVRLDFTASVFIGCAIEGYGDDTADFINTISLQL